MMPRPRRSETIEAELDAAIDAVIAAGERPTFVNVAERAGRARGLLSRIDTAYQAPRARILALAPPPTVRTVATGRAMAPANRSTEPEARTLPDAKGIEKRLVTASATIAALLAVLSDRPTSSGAQGREARHAAKAKRKAADAFRGD